MVPEPPLPPTLYKYCPPERVDILANGQIAFSHRLALNDIFEMRPRVALDFQAYLRARETVISQNPYMPVTPESTQEEDERVIYETCAGST